MALELGMGRDWPGRDWPNGRGLGNGREVLGWEREGLV